MEAAVGSGDIDSAVLETGGFVVANGWGEFDAGVYICCSAIRGGWLEETEEIVRVVLEGVDGDGFGGGRVCG